MRMPRVTVKGSLPRLTRITSLAARGYRTAAFTGGANLSAHFGFDVGFERYETYGKRMFDNVEAAKAWLSENASERFLKLMCGFYYLCIVTVTDRRRASLWTSYTSFTMNIPARRV